MKNIFLNLCVAAGLVLGFFQPVSAESFIQCNSYVNIRQQPSTSSPIVGYIQNEGYIEEVIENTQNGWSKIKSGNVIGWIDNHYIVEAHLGAIGYTVAIVKKDNVPVTKYQNPNSEIITTLTKGDTVECVKQKDLSIILAFKNGVYGFADANSVKIKNYCTTAKTIEENEANKDTVIEMTVSQPFEKFEKKELPIVQIDQNISNNTINQSVSTIETIDQKNYEIEENFYDYQDNDNEFYYNDFNYNYNNYYEEENLIEDNSFITEPLYQQDINEEYDGLLQDQETEFLYQQDINEEYDGLLQDQETEFLYQQDINEDNSDIISYGNQFVGNPYVWGGNSLTDGIDCSHFVWQVLSNTGHYSGDYEVSDGWANLGEEVGSLDEAVAGDVIVYPGHVALYDGQGSLLQARGSAYGITNDRDATYGDILAIRHFD